MFFFNVSVICFNEIHKHPTVGTFLICKAKQRRMTSFHDSFFVVNTSDLADKMFFFYLTGKKTVGNHSFLKTNLRKSCDTAWEVIIQFMWQHLSLSFIINWLQILFLRLKNQCILLIIIPITWIQVLSRFQDKAIITKSMRWCLQPLEHLLLLLCSPNLSSCSII